MKELPKFYAIYYSWNDKEPRYIDVLAYLDVKELNKLRKTKLKTRNDVKDYLKREFMYHFWSKCEYEIIVSDLLDKNGETEQKIDVWYQIEPNLDIITDIVIKAMNWKGLD